MLKYCSGSHSGEAVRCSRTRAPILWFSFSPYVSMLVLSTPGQKCLTVQVHWHQ